MYDESLALKRHVKWEQVEESYKNNLPFYLDIVSPSGEDTEKLRNVFHFHPNNIEDCTTFSEISKYEEHKKYLFTVIHCIVFNKETEAYENHDVHIFFNDKFVISVHEKEFDLLHNVAERLMDSKDKIDFKCDRFFYAIIDSIVDTYSPALNYWSSKIDDFEELVFDTKAKDDITSIVIPIRRGLLSIKRIVVPQKEIIYKFSHEENKYISDEIRIYFKDVYDHIMKSYNAVEEQRDILSNLTDAHFSKSSAALNVVITRLTLISTVFLPLTFIVGVYGMNFKYMPELEWKYGYFAIMLFMAFLSGALVMYFKKKKWF